MSFKRITHDGLIRLVNGLGGKGIYPFKKLAPWSQLFNHDDYGARSVEANTDSIAFNLINKKSRVVDRYTIYRSAKTISLQMRSL